MTQQSSGLMEAKVRPSVYGFKGYQRSGPWQKKGLLNEMNREGDWLFSQGDFAYTSLLIRRNKAKELFV